MNKSTRYPLGVAFLVIVAFLILKKPESGVTPFVPEIDPRERTNDLDRLGQSTDGIQAEPSETTEHHTDAADANEAERLSGAAAGSSPLALADDPALILDDRFFDTPIYKQWQQFGVTRQKVYDVIDYMRSQGFSGARLTDPSLIAQFLPYENIEPIYVDSIDLPAEASAGVPVSFSIKANYPDPSFTFEKWEISQHDRTISVRLVGSKTGEPVGAIVVPVDLEGELPKLEPGDYTVRFVAIGDPIEKNLVIK